MAAFGGSQLGGSLCGAQGPGLRVRHCEHPFISGHGMWMCCMSVTAQAQAVSKAIDAFKDTPTSETFQALREKLTTVIGYQCFAALPNVAVESGGTCPPRVRSCGGVCTVPVRMCARIKAGGRAGSARH